MDAVIIDGTEYGARLKTLVSEAWVRSVFGGKVRWYLPMSGYTLAGVVETMAEEATAEETVIVFPDFTLDDHDRETTRQLILYLQGLLALIKPGHIIVAPLIEARCEDMDDVVALGKAHGLEDSVMRECRDYPSTTTSI